MLVNVYHVICQETGEEFYRAPDRRAAEEFLESYRGELLVKNEYDTLAQLLMIVETMWGENETLHWTKKELKGYHPAKEAKFTPLAKEDDSAWQKEQAIIRAQKDKESKWKTKQPSQGWF